MSIKEKISQITEGLNSTLDDEDEVIDETTNDPHSSINQVFQDQENVIQRTGNLEEELINLLASDSTHILDKAEEFVEWEIEIARVFEKTVEDRILDRIVTQLNNDDWEGLENSEQALAQTLRDLEEDRQQIVNDMSEENVETIEFLLDDDNVVQDIKGLHDLIEEETQEEQLIEEQVGEDQQVAEQERELQQVRSNFRELIQIKNRIQRLKSKRKSALKSSKQSISEALNQINTAKNSIPRNRENIPHNFNILEAVLADLGGLADQIHTGQKKMSRRDFVTATTMVIGTIAYSSTLIGNLKKFEEQMNEQVEEAEKEIRQKRKRKQKGKTRPKDLDKERGTLNSEDNPFQIDYLIQNTEFNDKALELKITNTAERKVQLSLSFVLPSSGVNLHGGINIQSSSADLISSEIQLKSGETEEVGIFYRRTNPNAELVSLTLDYTFDGNNWYEDRLNVSFNGRNVQKMIQNQGTIQRQDLPFVIEWRTLETFLEQNEFINLELVARPRNTTEAVELQYSIHVANNWNMTGLTGFQSSEDNTANTGELHLEGGKKQDSQEFPLFPGGQKVNELSLQKAARGKDTAEIDIKTSGGKTVKELIQLI